MIKHNNESLKSIVTKSRKRLQPTFEKDKVYFINAVLDKFKFQVLPKRAMQLKNGRKKSAYNKFSSQEQKEIHVLVSFMDFVNNNVCPLRHVFLTDEHFDEDSSGDINESGVF